MATPGQALRAGAAARGGGLHVVVIGASFAGLFTAAAAAGAGCRVTVLERDRLPEDPQPRPGVPQSEQPHVFLYRGLLAAEQLLPGLADDLVGRGAVRLHTGRLPWLGEFGWNLLGDHGFEVISCTRTLLEHAVRQRVTALRTVEIREGVTVAGLRRLSAGWVVEVEGAATVGAATAGAATAGAATVGADVVVDASGRNSRLPVWLERLGVPAVTVSTIDARVGYASRRYIGPPGVPVVITATPQTGRGGLALPVEGDGWLVSAVGTGELRPPRDPEGFLAHFAQLPDTAIADQVPGWTPVTDVAIHRQTANVRHHYETAKGWPPGLVAVGDALCAFDPIYGQGVAVSACQAVELGPRLRTLSSPARTRRLQRRLAGLADLPWAIATGQDLRFPTSGGRQTRRQALLSGWARQVGRLASCGDLRAAATLSRTYHLVGSPVELFHPALIMAAVTARLRGFPPGNERPASLPGGPGSRSEGAISTSGSPDDR